MNKIFKTAALCFLANNFFASVIYTNPSDQLLSLNQPELSLDIDNSGSNDFTFMNDGFGITIFFEPMENSISTVSDTQWDVMKAYSAGVNINSTSGWFSFGDAFLNPGFAQVPFPSGDQYLGVKFLNGTNLHYGWILVNLQDNGDLLVKSYAYENVPNATISTGATGSTANLDNADFQDISIFPNPSVDGSFNVEVKENAVATVYDLQGKIILVQNLKIGNNKISIEDQNSSFYVLSLIGDTQNQTLKLRKNRF